MPKKSELVGQKFNRLLVLKQGGRIRKQQTLSWVCVCDCGKEVIADSASLIRGSTKSCGCLQPEAVRLSGTIHGHTKTGWRSSEYQSWLSMRDRVLNKKHEKYPVYGGAGITICERWVNSFPNFLEDMGIKPTKKHTIDRFPNKEGNYSLENCRWATQPEQLRNTKRNVWIEYNGVKMVLSDWAKELGIKGHGTLKYHLSKGISFDKVYEYFKFGKEY